MEDLRKEMEDIMTRPNGMSDMAWRDAVELLGEEPDGIIVCQISEDSKEDLRKEMEER